MSANPVRTVTILYVEDNDDLRATIGELLRRPDRDVALCANAEDALVVDAERRFDIVVTDISLPGISGADLAQQLVAADPARRVVLCSGYDIGEHVRRFGSNVRAIMKPFEIDDLDTLIDELCAAVRSSASERFSV
jgi:two-component system cell cycle response regulator CpdR